MKKLANLFLMLALFTLPIACGGGLDGDVPPVTENPPAPPSDNTPPDNGNNIPPLTPVPFETPEVCPVDDPDCGHHHPHPELAPSGPPKVYKKPDWELSIASPNPAQINPCLENPDAEGCDE